MRASPSRKASTRASPTRVSPAAHDFGHQDQLGARPLCAAGHARLQGFDSFTEEAAQDYGGQVPPSDPRRQLQAFDAIYDQPPQIALGSNDQARRAPQDFYESERIDADFLDEGQAASAARRARQAGMTIRGRSAFMVGSALLGAIALGGALGVRL